MTRDIIQNEVNAHIDITFFRIRTVECRVYKDCNMKRGRSSTYQIAVATAKLYLSNKRVKKNFSFPSSSSTSSRRVDPVNLEDDAVLLLVSDSLLPLTLTCGWRSISFSFFSSM